MKQNKRNYFVFYKEFFETFNSLEKDDAIQYIKNLSDYAFNDKSDFNEGSKIAKTVTKLSVSNFNLFNIRLDSSNWAELREIVFDRDNYTCKYCGQIGGKLECDHIVPISKGGSNKLSNLTTACLKCNRSKRNKNISEWSNK